MTITGILRRLGPVGRRIAWDREFLGTPSFVGPRSAVMNELCAKYLPGRRVIELACGRGDLWWRWGLKTASYVGYDVSPIAIANGTSLGGDFRVGTMEAWRPDGSFDMLVIEEGIYYVNGADQRAILKRAFDAGAKVLLTVHDAAKHAKSLANCEAASKMMEKRVDGSRVFLVLTDAR